MVQTAAQREAEEHGRLLAEALEDYQKFCAHLVQIVPKEGPKTTLTFNEIQRLFHRDRSGRDIILKGRQIGKTAEAMARDVWKFVAGTEQRVVIVCQSIKDNVALKKLSNDIRVMLDGLRDVGLQLNFGVESAALWTLPETDCSLQIIEAGASVAAATKKGRAGTYSRVHITEASFFEHPELTTNALLEGVPQGAHTEIEIESTPNGVGNWFHRMYVGAAANANGYRDHFYPWFLEPGYATPLAPDEVIEPQNERERELFDVHHLSQEQVKWYRRKVASKTQDEVDQEYPTDPFRCFLSSGHNYFDVSKLEAMAGRMTAPIVSNGFFRQWAGLDPDDTAVIGVDPAEGLGPDGDWSVATAWSRKKREHLWTLRAKLRATPFAREILKYTDRLRNPRIVVERNKGMALIEALETLDYRNVYYDQDSKPGVHTSETSRVLLLEQLADAVRDQVLHTKDIVGISEMRAFVINPKSGRPYAPGKGTKDGASDDWIFSAALAWRVLQIPEAPAASTEGDRGFAGDWSEARGW